MSLEYLMVLNDGDTYTELAGCRIVRIDAKALSENQDWNLENGYKGALLTAANASDDEGVEVVAEFEGDEADGAPIKLSLLLG